MCGTVNGCRLFPKFVVREAYKDFQIGGRQTTLDLVEYLALLAAAGPSLVLLHHIPESEIGGQMWFRGCRS